MCHNCACEKEDVEIVEDSLTFYYRDEGWYEDDPDYYYEGSFGDGHIKLAIPKLPGRGPYKVTLKLEKL